MHSLHRLKKSISNTLLFTPLTQQHDTTASPPARSQSTSPSHAKHLDQPAAYHTHQTYIDMDEGTQTPTVIRRRENELSLYDARLISVDDALTLASLLFAVLSTHQLLTLDVDPDVAFNCLISTILFLTALFLALVYRSTPVLINILPLIDDTTLRVTARIIGYVSNLAFSAGILTFLLSGVCIQLRRYQDLSYPLCTAIISPLLCIAALNILIATYILYYRIRSEYNHTTGIDNRSPSATERTPLLHSPMFK